MSEVIPEKYCVLSRTNGHAEPYGPTVRLFEDEDAAHTEATAQMGKNPKAVVGVFRQIAEYHPKDGFEVRKPEGSE